MKNHIKVKKNRKSDYKQLCIEASDEAFEVLVYGKPMTNDIYESILNTCVDFGLTELAIDFLHLYPEHAARYADIIEKRLSDVHLPEDTPERITLFRERLLQKLSEETP